MTDLDEEKLRSLQELLGAKLPDIAKEFLVNSVSYASDARTALEAANRKGALAAAHKLKSSSAMFGWNLVSQLADTMEHQAMSGDLNVLLELQARIEQALQDASVWLREKMNPAT